MITNECTFKNVPAHGVRRWTKSLLHSSFIHSE